MNLIASESGSQVSELIEHSNKSSHPFRVRKSCFCSAHSGESMNAAYTDKVHGFLPPLPNVRGDILQGCSTSAKEFSEENSDPWSKYATTSASRRDGPRRGCRRTRCTRRVAAFVRGSSRKKKHLVPLVLPSPEMAASKAGSEWSFKYWFQDQFFGGWGRGQRGQARRLEAQRGAFG